MLQEIIDQQLNCFHKYTNLTLPLIEIKSKQIKSLNGIGLYPNLSQINLANNLIMDLTPLKELKHIKQLNLSYNQITDI